MSLLTVDAVSSGYGQMEILRALSIRVERGEIVTLIGPNGAGKSTLLKTIFGLLPPRRGRIVFDGEEITGLPPSALVRRGMSYVPQVDNVFPSLSVEENLEMGAVIRRDDVRARLTQVLALFPNLAGKRRQKVGDLSGGERQMVAMSRALMLDPRLLLLDEPSAGLAPLAAERLFESIAAVNREGVAVAMVEQNASEALAVADRAYILVDGRNHRSGSAAELAADPDIRRIFLGR